MEKDFYDQEFLEESMDDDAITDFEEAFMRGYLDA